MAPGVGRRKMVRRQANGGTVDSSGVKPDLCNAKADWSERKKFFFLSE